ncbi:uncharacterized protein LOC126973113 [Leptidea sinapis]|uniref:uncharacterized protein LOC126973113 n=1 Tax=Leptidea sinapis TaxID=189913 RepID=UPI0021C4BB86|nr:uncharacterized protein LOC126973113 [Leptidea sinapis]
MSSVQEEKPSNGVQKTQIHDIRNTELVSRLLAATPPYLYSALPLQPHAFFFSEMLRSFVSARHGCRPSHYQRRFKRRAHKYFAENETDWRREWPKQDEEKKEEPRPEVPLELTVDKQPRIGDPLPRRMSPKPEQHKSSESPGPPERQSTYVDVGTEELPKPSPCVGRTLEPAVPANLILPPPPPMWYPPIYNPQFGVDPLNFFIDLRVSGHIYDRKRPAEEMEQSIPEVRSEEPLEKRLTKEFVQRPRHLSAFSVPVRGNTDVVDKRVSGGSTKNASYIMKNLKRVYEDLHTRDKQNDHSNVDTKAESSDDENDIID